MTYKKIIPCLFLLLILLSGCSSPYINGFSGTTPVLNLEEHSSSFNKNTSVSYFNGREIVTKTIKVSKPIGYKESKELINKLNLDTSKIVEDETSSLYCFYISGTEEYIPTIITDYNKEELNYNGINYSQNVYPLTNNLYCFKMPNGCKQCLIKVGDTYFQ